MRITKSTWGAEKTNKKKQIQQSIWRTKVTFAWGGFTQRRLKSDWRKYRRPKKCASLKFDWLKRPLWILMFSYLLQRWGRGDAVRKKWWHWEGGVGVHCTSWRVERTPLEENETNPQNKKEWKERCAKVLLLPSLAQEKKQPNKRKSRFCFCFVCTGSWLTSTGQRIQCNHLTRCWHTDPKYALPSLSLSPLSLGSSRRRRPSRAETLTDGLPAYC